MDLNYEEMNMNEETQKQDKEARKEFERARQRAKTILKSNHEEEYLKILKEISNGKQKDIEAEGFVEVEYENNDVDTDRGVWRNRDFYIVFKNYVIWVGEEDFNALTDAMKPYVKSMEAEETLEKEMEKIENDK